MHLNESTIKKFILLVVSLLDMFAGCNGGAISQKLARAAVTWM
jgi:hypothetical protein